MKSILIVIYAHYVKLIIEGKKTVEIRKNKNLANAIKKLIAEQGGCWIYIYVAKDSKHDWYYDKQFGFYFKDIKDHNTAYEYGLGLIPYNGKVVARFWCDNVERIYIKYGLGWTSDGVNNCTKQIEKESCLSRSKIYEYAKNSCYAIHISKLEVFDKPRELYEFKTPKQFENYQRALREASEDDYKLWEKYDGDFPEDVCANNVELIEMAEGYYGLTKAPQNYCYVKEPTP